MNVFKLWLFRFFLLHLTTPLFIFLRHESFKAAMFRVIFVTVFGLGVLLLLDYFGITKTT